MTRQTVKEKAFQEIKRQYIDPFNQRKSRKEVEQPQSASGSSSAPMRTRTRSAMAGDSEGTENRHLSLLKEFDEESSEEEIGEKESTGKESSREEVRLRRVPNISGPIWHVVHEFPYGPVDESLVLLTKQAGVGLTSTQESKKRKGIEDLPITPYSTGDSESSPQQNGERATVDVFLEPEDEAVVRAIIEKYANRLLAACDGTDDMPSDGSVDWEFGMSGWDSHS
ncbi:hypothetical protein H2201_002176 [Coniosporium apollinis]|uniref:Uncharacterized protein n=1 Tax=Coniosporium apollinis TaxID=61459 RepID=A0ABQ9P2T0_9PEZI|nr:hypothetical protein H2201_002176 [Coniosporium apollinis]